MHELASLIVAAAGVYGALGLIFAVAFVLVGAARVDPAAERCSVGFKLLILPGCAALWPLLVRRWWTGGQPPVEHTPHRDAAEGGRAEP